MPLSPETQLQPHQERLRAQAAAAAASGKPFRVLANWGLGSGKSLGALSAADVLGGSAAVVGPAALRPTLRGEQQKFLGHSDIPVYSYQAAASGKVPPVQTLVTDEAQRLNSPSSAQAAAVAELAQKAKNVILLSGTPTRNSPREFAPLLSILANKHISQDEFARKFIGTRSYRPGGLLGLLRGVPKVEEPALVNTDELRDALAGHVDYYKPENPPVGVRHETHDVEMTPRQASLYAGMIGRLPALMRWKLRWNYPLTDEEMTRARSFLTGPRQVSLSDFPYASHGDPYRSFLNSGKLQKAFGLMKDNLDKDERRKGIVYSNFLQAGLVPYSAALTKEGVPHAIFHGGLSDVERKALVDGFNRGDIRVALVAPSGAEGISLKGAQTLQVLDGAWNQARTEQAIGRGIRFDSHRDLPEVLRHITVQKFVSKLPLGVKDRLLESIGFDRSAKRTAVDDYLVNLADRKERLNRQLHDLLREVGTPKTAAEADAAVDELAHLLSGEEFEKMAAVAASVAKDRGPEAEYCPHCDARLERDPYSGTCNSCGKDWPQKGADESSPFGDWKKLAADFAPGIADRADYGDHTKLPINQLVDFIIQSHNARRAGQHYDVRLGNPDTGLYSWATRKELPQPGDRPTALFQQPVHSHAYGSFQGMIPEGYGAGTVKIHTKGWALVTKVTPNAVHFTIAHTGSPQRFALMRVGGDKNWLLVNSTPRQFNYPPKISYKSIPQEKAEDVLKDLQPGASAQAKIDGSAALTELGKGKFDTFSYRAEKSTGRPIPHTERLTGGRPEIATPKDLEGTVLRGELYGTRGGKGIEPQELGGLLNSSVAKSLETQKERGIDLKKLIFDIQRLGKKPVDPNATPYADRLAMVRDVLSRAGLPSEKFHAPEEVKTPEEALALWRQVTSGQHPITDEGLVVHPPTGAPSKIKAHQEFDVYPRQIIPGRGKYEGNAAGAFAYSHEPTGSVVGEVGSGMSDAVRREMTANPEKYLGQIARVRAQEKFPSGALRAPVFVGMHLDKVAATSECVCPKCESTDVWPHRESVRKAMPCRRCEKCNHRWTEEGFKRAAQDDRFRLAKEYSDMGTAEGYRQKTALLRQLIAERPDEWYIDSADHPYVVGVTHRSGWRYHLPRFVVQDLPISGYQGDSRGAPATRSADPATYS